MDSSTTNLVLAANAAIDLQLHSTYSDGTWIPEQLLDHLAHEQFGLAAITDHERVDIAAALQQLALERNMPLLVAVEMSATWHSEPTDFLCFGFDAQSRELNNLAQDVLYRQQQNTREVYENLRHKGFRFSQEIDELSIILEKPSAQQLHQLVALVKRHNHADGEPSAGKIVFEAGGAYATNSAAAIVDAAHKDGAICILAHPGRADGFVTYDARGLDELRQEAPIDGLEAYYPAHSSEQTAMFLDYAQRHHLLISAGSDSHGPGKPPIQYRAKLCQALLERMGIQVKA